MNNNKKQMKTLPQVKLGSNDMKVVASILMAHTRYLQHAPLTAQTLQHIRELKDLRARLSFLLSADGNTALLTQNDVSAILVAFTTFVKMIRRIIPPSQERNAILQTIDALQKHIKQDLVPS